MNLGSGKYRPDGPSCTYKGKAFPYIVEFSEGGGVSGHVLTNLLRNFNYFKLYDNDRKYGIIPSLLVDGHGSPFDLVFLKYICDKNHKCTVVFGVPYGT